MAGKKLTVVVAQHQGKHPVKRDLEETIAAELLMDPNIDVSLVPHIYDMAADHTGMLFLRSVNGPLVVLSWLYPRSARWILDRQGVRGQEGISQLKAYGEDDDEENETEPATDESAEEDTHEAKGIGSVDVPKRKLWCLDLRAYDDSATYLEEIRRIAKDATMQTVDLMGWINGSPEPAQLDRYLNADSNGTAPAVPANNGSTNGEHLNHGDQPELGPPTEAAAVTDATGEATKRRWYPVIDYSRCTNCMECIDFCLFGVYGVDQIDRILVEEQDNCKKGCPACSRVCPENAIIFPQHKDDAIAGADGPIGNLKIDLSRLFGGDDSEKTPLELAVMERDTELVADGRTAVGMQVGIPKRQPDKQSIPKDDLDDLMDGLDDLDL